LNSELVELRDHELALPLALRAVKMDGAKDANLLETLALAHQRNGNLDYAIATQRQALDQARLGGPYNRADVEAKLTSYLIEKGDLLGATAVSWQNLASRLGRTLLSGETPGVSLIAQAEDLMAEGRFSEAAAVLRGCLAIRQKELPAGDWMIADTQSQLGAAIAADGKLSEAEPILLEAYADFMDSRQAPLDRKRLAVERIIRLYQRWDKPEQVSKWSQQLNDMAGDDDRQAGANNSQATSAQRGPVARAGRLLEDYQQLLSEAIRWPQLGTPNRARLNAGIVAPLVENEERRC
jgi:tetratricopeptide (TPR) repeat protein